MSCCPLAAKMMRRLLMTVDVQSLRSHRALRLLDGSCLDKHMLLFTMLAVPGIHYTQQELERCTLCASEVLLQTALQLAVRVLSLDRPIREFCATSRLALQSWRVHMEGGVEVAASRSQLKIFTGFLGSKAWQLRASLATFKAVWLLVSA